jgi:HlyD family secretion protein
MGRWRLLKNPRVLLGLAFLGLLTAASLRPATVVVDVARVTRGPLSVTVDEEAETRVRRRFVVSAPVAGRVGRIELEPGDAVQRGRTLLATFFPADPTPLDARAGGESAAAARAARASWERARAERERARAALTLATSEERRARDLAGQQLLAPAELETSEMRAREAAAALEAAEYAATAAEHQLQAAQARLTPPRATGARREIELRAPVDGVVLRRLRESESVVPAGQPLLELGDPAAVEIVCDLLSTDAVRVRAGQAALVEHWGGEGTLRARVRRVEPSGFMKVSALGVEEQRVNVVLDFEGAADERRALGDGYRVELRIVVAEAAQALKAPHSAFFRRGDQWMTFAVEGGRTRLRRVELGLRSGVEAEIRAGLAEGAAVVLHAGDRVEDGTRVAPREE